MSDTDKSMEFREKSSGDKDGNNEDDRSVYTEKKNWLNNIALS